MKINGTIKALSKKQLKRYKELGNIPPYLFTKEDYLIFSVVGYNEDSVVGKFKKGKMVLVKEKPPKQLAEYYQKLK